MYCRHHRRTLLSVWWWSRATGRHRQCALQGVPLSRSAHPTAVRCAHTTVPRSPLPWSACTSQASWTPRRHRSWLRTPRRHPSASSPLCSRGSRLSAQPGRCSLVCAHLANPGTAPWRPGTCSTRWGGARRCSPRWLPRRSLGWTLTPPGAHRRSPSRQPPHRSPASTTKIGRLGRAQAAGLPSAFAPAATTSRTAVQKLCTSPTGAPRQFGRLAMWRARSTEPWCAPPILRTARGPTGEVTIARTSAAPAPSNAPSSAPSKAWGAPGRGRRRSRPSPGQNQTAVTPHGRGVVRAAMSR
mmetsp:Transcript_18256/g.47688  ORF Transcript_18256/g.47688 Transcript_18256/m.47688 type:complete len:299 (+) Transcript_18256:273-1169(+)